MLLLAACKESDWVVAAKAIDAFSQGLVAIQTAETAAYHDHLLSDQEHLNFEDGLGKVATSGLALSQTIHVSHDTKSAAAEVQATLNGLDLLINEDVIPIQNTGVKATLLVAINSAKGFIVTIMQLGGK